MVSYEVVLFHDTEANCIIISLTKFLFICKIHVIKLFRIFDQRQLKNNWLVIFLR